MPNSEKAPLKKRHPQFQAQVGQSVTAQEQLIAKIQDLYQAKFLNSTSLIKWKAGSIWKVLRFSVKGVFV